MWRDKVTGKWRGKVFFQKDEGRLFLFQENLLSFFEHNLNSRPRYRWNIHVHWVAWYGSKTVVFAYGCFLVISWTGFPVGKDFPPEVLSKRDDKVWRDLWSTLKERWPFTLTPSYHPFFKELKGAFEMRATKNIGMKRRISCVAMTVARRHRRACRDDETTDTSAPCPQYWISGAFHIVSFCARHWLVRLAPGELELCRHCCCLLLRLILPRASR